MVKDERLPPLPTREEVIEQIRGLINGGRSRGSVADWAQKWIISDGRDLEYPIPDEKAWRMLSTLMGADTKTAPDSYFFGEEDFKDWLQEMMLSE